jgi:hypothetical protein
MNSRGGNEFRRMVQGFMPKGSGGGSSSGSSKGFLASGGAVLALGGLAVAANSSLFNGKSMINPLLRIPPL